MISRVEHTLEPIFDKKSKTLILGTMPSVESRKEGMYYANKTNRFWLVMAAVYNEKIKDRKAFILRHHLALWDVVVNDINSIIRQSKIKHIFLLGRKAYDLYYEYLYREVGIKGIYLSSTSGANARKSYCDLVEEYKIIKKVTR